MANRGNKSELEKLQVCLNVHFFFNFFLFFSLQEAFYNFDEEKVPPFNLFCFFAVAVLTQLMLGLAFFKLNTFFLLQQGYISIDDLRYIVTTDGNPLSGPDLEEFLQEADIYKNGVIDYKAFAGLLLAEDAE